MGKYSDLVRRTEAAGAVEIGNKGRSDTRGIFKNRGLIFLLASPVAALIIGAVTTSSSIRTAIRLPIFFSVTA
jgi:hypothetical protein